MGVLPLLKIKIRFRTLVVQTKILYGEISCKKKMKDLKNISIYLAGTLDNNKACLLITFLLAQGTHIVWTIRRSKTNISLYPPGNGNALLLK